ncbi:phosphonopyruvate decarboxylase [Candidatus Kaiserbacteria bacterium RIFCSPLOWO2_12_FULL_52_8]|uniref:Phosphonopyruvate decarboxylase n=1 Tax=Candidatus Kaiserbacteria bacterium RIFCSPHIGHO2_01_FULL_53_31 TaxID=1798481 RepID=A0A1F6CGD1_9BACT|nr:MAG: phosphonopyruvate decarboxylase [Candidatus Kaiserbacteria bacterium RIFCSPHIGHO2_01_FULL_53_31]OGG92750.1 MAG: phosphonopyruvate decarboxylase [Candidatus Kaiserbacteria bacterium RIFCSPLOWO2_12_FULL_52_8]
MVYPKTIFDALRGGGGHFFTGVPDSLLKNFCAYVSDHTNKRLHVIAANEGNAISLAVGHYLATGKVGVVYLQNSGIGNAVNPLLSLAGRGVYGIPMLLIIGWRGEPGIKDEPQHLTQGPLTLPLLTTLKIPHAILPQTDAKAVSVAQKMYERAKKENRPVAIVVREGTFAPYTSVAKKISRYPLTREAALEMCVSAIEEKAIVVSTTGKLSRELFELRKRKGGQHEKDFLTVGSMGHASQIALGIALAQPARPVYCFDGDGAAIMHLGGWVVIGQAAPKNFKHIVFNNGVHESVGGQPTAGYIAHFEDIARACGYKNAAVVSDPKKLRTALTRVKKLHGPALLEIRIKEGSRSDLGRPTRTPLENKKDFMSFLRRITPK